jgi:hypothetical protein
MQRFDIKLFRDKNNKVNRIIFNEFYVVRYKDSRVYYCHYANKVVTELPEWFNEDWVQNLIKQVWKD